MHKLTSLVVSSLITTTLFACRPALERELVEVDGRQVEIATRGTTGPSVVLEAGLGGDYSVWEAVASRIPERARVFAWSRPGNGASTPADAPRDAAHIVEELHAVLIARGVTAPWVLVGHSFGGGYVEFFARRYPSEVAALVLVDERHRDFSAQCAAAGLSGCGIPPAAVPGLPEVQQRELAGYDALSGEMAQEAPRFGPFPVRVLIATEHPPHDAAREALWRGLLESLAAEADDGRTIVLTGAGHNLHAERPDDVANTIRDVLP
ncbi:MAG: alpha/beta fold hydrolase [Myxococcaceae bacterium]